MEKPSPSLWKMQPCKGSLNLRDWYTASLPFYSERLQILNRCGIKIWAKPPLGAKGFEPVVVPRRSRCEPNESASSI